MRINLPKWKLSTKTQLLQLDLTEIIEDELTSLKNKVKNLRKEIKNNKKPKKGPMAENTPIQSIKKEKRSSSKPMSKQMESQMEKMIRNEKNFLNKNKKGQDPKREFQGSKELQPSNQILPKSLLGKNI